MAVQSPTLGSSEQPVQIRKATPADAEVCGKICYEAFATLARHHNFPEDFPSVEVGVGILSYMFSHPAFYCVVAEQDGKIIGSNCLDERNPISGVGPITIDPNVQNRTAGRQLMLAVMKRSEERKFAGIRLVQEAYHNRSLALYAKLGFVIREPLSCMQGPAIQKKTPGFQVRPARPSDLAACNDFCAKIHGHNRSGELSDGIKDGSAVVVESRGRITGYASSFAFSGHGVGETSEDLFALIASASAFQGPGILIPSRNAALFRWCLENGLRVVQQATLMTIGLYNEPAGAYFPSITY
jgi:L-amino acid N-acyltransferase YncA